jgi:hypothetical protein
LCICNTPKTTTFCLFVLFLFYFILFYFILFYFILFYFILFFIFILFFFFRLLLICFVVEFGLSNFVNDYRY